MRPLPCPGCQGSLDALLGLQQHLRTPFSHVAGRLSICYRVSWGGGNGDLLPQGLVCSLASGRQEGMWLFCTGPAPSSLLPI